MTKIEEFVESMKPRTTKERKKLIRTISQVGVRNEGDHYAIMVPKDIMGIPYEGDLYILPMLMHATPLKLYEKNYKRYAAFTQDEKGRYWLRVAHDVSAYDDYQQVFFTVRNECEAADIYARVGADTMTYFWCDHNKMIVPHFRANEGTYLTLAVHTLPVSKDEMFAQVIENNVLILKGSDMSRSVRKNPILKYGGDTRESWKECKKMINRYNRRKSKEAIRNNEDIPFKEKKLCFWDWDFCKWY